ncbi:MAG: hypothetical protein ACYSWP_01010 [Planctomycetota bacterium]|jgi:hypothetical protein
MVLFKSKLSYKVFGLFLLSLMGCAPKTVFISRPPIKTAIKPGYELKFEPLKRDSKSFEVFRLTIKNKTDEEFQIDWHKTSYLRNGRKYGMFVSKDTEAGKVMDPEKRYDIIAPGETYTKIIAPLKLVAWAVPKYSATKRIDESPFSAGPIPAGKSGILLVIKQEEKELTERISVDIIEEEIK